MNNLIQMTQIISGQTVLILDDSNVYSEYLKVSSKNLKKLVGSKEYMNHFDVIVCTNAFYTLLAKNRHLFLQTIVWLLSRSSKFVFSVPNINSFKKDKQYKIKDKKDYYQIIKKSGFLREEVSYWYKEVVDDPLDVFKKWNIENPRSQWDLDQIVSKNSDNYFDISIDMMKTL
jgi:hypothetical protein